MSPLRGATSAQICGPDFLQLGLRLGQVRSAGARTAAVRRSLRAHAHAQSTAANVPCAIPSSLHGRVL